MRRDPKATKGRAKRDRRLRPQLYCHHCRTMTDTVFMRGGFGGRRVYRCQNSACSKEIQIKPAAG